MGNSKMKKTLGNIILGTVFLAGSIFCAGKYATADSKGDAFRDFIGHLAAKTLVEEGIKKEMGHSNYQQQERQSQQGRTELPENVIYSDGKYNPAPGYKWVNPNDQKDLRVISSSSAHEGQHGSGGGMDLWRTYVESGGKAYDSGKYQNAEELFKEAMREVDRSDLKRLALTQGLLGMAERELGKLPQAEALLRKSIDSGQLVGAQQVLALIPLSLIHVENGNYATAEVLYNQATDELKDDDRNILQKEYTKKYRKACRLRAHASYKRSDYPSALLSYQMAHKRAPKSSRALNNLAWLRSTCPEASCRDGSQAVLLAEKAVAITKRKNHLCLDTLAAAYAEATSFEQAVATQKEAIALVSDEQHIADYGLRLKLYESQKPYRDTGKLDE